MGENLWAVIDMQEGKENSAKYQLHLKTVFTQTALPKDIALNSGCIKMILFSSPFFAECCDFQCQLCDLYSADLESQLKTTYFIEALKQRCLSIY